MQVLGSLTGLAVGHPGGCRGWLRRWRCAPIGGGCPIFFLPVFGGQPELPVRGTAGEGGDLLPGAAVSAGGRRAGTPLQGSQEGGQLCHGWL